MLLEAINHHKGDVNELPTETEEWTGSVAEVGGLWYVTDAAHQFFCSIEYSLQQYLHVTNAHLMDNTFRSKLTNIMVTEDDDVQFGWTIAASSMKEDIVDQAFEAILNLYITIRGFSFAASILEMYKQEAKKGTQKKKVIETIYKLVVYHTCIYRNVIHYTNMPTCTTLICGT